MPAAPRRETVPVWRSGERSPAQTRILQAIAGRAVAGAVLTFDLDSTLFDNRPRQLAILGEFARAHGLTGGEGLSPEEIDGWQVLGTILALNGAAGREDALRAAWKPFWSERFFTGRYCLHDRPLPGAADYVKRVE